MLSTLEYKILGHFLSDFDGSLETVYRVVTHPDTKVWEPYENWDLGELSDHIESIVRSIAEDCPCRR